MKYLQKKAPKGNSPELGKIGKISFGIGGYQDAQFGLSVELNFSGGSACNDYITGGWAYGQIDPDPKYAKWNEEDRSKQMSLMCKDICSILKDAQVYDINQLVGKPIEVTMKNFNEIESWRILKEVL